MTNEEAIKHLTAKLECLTRSKGFREKCDTYNSYEGCYECDLAYKQGNIGEQIESFKIAIQALEEKPYEKFENVKDHIYKLASDYKCWDNRITDNEAIELCHILEQEPILDKIREDINNLTVYYTTKDKRINLISQRAVNRVIDKYRK